MWYGYIFIYGYLILQLVQVRLILIDLCTYMLYITLHYPATPMSLGTNKALVLDINICPGQVNSVFGQVACLMQLSHPFSTRKKQSSLLPHKFSCVSMMQTNQRLCSTGSRVVNQSVLLLWKNKSWHKGLIHILHPPLDSHETTWLTLEKLWDPTWWLEIGLMTAQSLDRTAKVP